MFTDKEVEYLTGQRIGRLASVTADGEPHVVPTGFRLDDERTAIEVGGHKLSSRRPLWLRNIEAMITPTRITGWGLDGPAYGPANSRKVSQTP